MSLAVGEELESIMMNCPLLCTVAAGCAASETEWRIGRLVLVAF